MKRNANQHQSDQQRAEQIKQLTIAALVSHDDLFDVLVLKGGNAIEHAGVEPVRRSIDVDFSIDGDLGELGELDVLRAFFETLLVDTFEAAGFHVFDVKLEEQPPNLKTDVLGDFWGGYQLRFKVIDAQTAEGLTEDKQRRRALALGKAERKEFIVDMSSHEFCEGKQMKRIGDHNVYIYSGQMIVCEKIRAICQQMQEYRTIVMSESARPRARDFFDIHHITTSLDIDFASPAFADTLKRTFEVKRAPLRLLGQIGESREFHRENFESVRQTVLQTHVLEEFDYYVDFLVQRLRPLQPLWEVDLPA